MVIQELVSQWEAKKWAHEREWWAKDERGEIEEQQQRDDVKEAEAEELIAEEEEWVSEEDEEGSTQSDGLENRRRWKDDIRNRAAKWYDKLMELEVDAEINALCVDTS